MASDDFPDSLLPPEHEPDDWHTVPNRLPWRDPQAIVIVLGRHLQSLPVSDYQMEHDPFTGKAQVPCVCDAYYCYGDCPYCNAEGEGVSTDESKEG